MESRGCGPTTLACTCCAVLLAAVLVGAFMSLLGKANATNDTAAVQSMDEFETVLCGMYVCFHLVCLGSIAHQVVRYNRIRVVPCVPVRPTAGTTQSFGSMDSNKQQPQPESFQIFQIGGGRCGRSRSGRYAPQDIVFYEASKLYRRIFSALGMEMSGGPSSCVP